MASTLSLMPRKKPPGYTPRPVGRPRVYPFDTWFDGSAHALRPGVDYKCTRESMRTQLYQAAKAAGVTVSVRNRDMGVLLVQAKRGNQARAHHDWDTLFNGDTHQVRLDLIDAKPTSFRTYARQVAKERGKRLTIKTIGNSVFLQATPLEPVEHDPYADLPFLMEKP